MGSSISSRLARLERRANVTLRSTGCPACDRATNWPLVFTIDGMPDQPQVPHCPACGRERGLAFRIVKVSEQPPVEN